MSDIDALADMVRQVLGDPVRWTPDDAAQDVSIALTALDALVAIAKEAVSTRQKMYSNAANLEFAIIERDAATERAERAERERDELQDWALDDLASATRQEG